VAGAGEYNPNWQVGMTLLHAQIDARRFAAMEISSSVSPKWVRSAKSPLTVVTIYYNIILIVMPQGLAWLSYGAYLPCLHIG
jgi:hypothetical protein